MVKRASFDHALADHRVNSLPRSAGFFFSLLLLLLVFPALAVAQNYRFSVDENRSDVFIRKDGGIDLEYVLTFTCAPGAHAIDVVDLGLPNRHYQLATARAWMDGAPVTEIKKSSVLPVGVEVHLGGRVIRPGQTGTLKFTITNARMVYPDTQDPTFAGVEFYPTYFGSSFTTGATRHQVAIHFPAGAEGDKVKWRHRKYDEWATDQAGRLSFIWRLEKASPSSSYQYGVSFPRDLVDQVFEPNRENTSSSGGTSDEDTSDWFATLTIIVFLVAIPFTIFVQIILSGRRRRMAYLPPTGSVEGAEIKRGLTAPEAALLLEAPLDKVAALLVFGLIKKKIARVKPGRELMLEILVPDVKDLRFYEKGLVSALDDQGRVDRRKLTDFFVKWIKDLNRRMTSFNRVETRAYYQRIVAEAWRQLEQARGAKELSSTLDDHFDWLLLDPNSGPRLRERLQTHEVLIPGWWTNCHPSSSFARNATGGFFASGEHFADAIVSRVEGVAHDAVGRLESFTGVVSQATNPAPVATTPAVGTHRGGGSHSCACACACAGCACACAGGGR